METICKNLKTSLPQLAMEQADNIFEIASKFSFGSRLSTFEAEYHMMAELNSSFKSNLIIDDFSSVAEVLKNQNVALIEQLAICHAGNNRLVTMVEALQTQMAAQDQRILEYVAWCSLGMYVGGWVGGAMSSIWNSVCIIPRTFLLVQFCMTLLDGFCSILSSMYSVSHVLMCGDFIQ